MALSQSVLSGLILSELQSKGWSINPGNQGQGDWLVPFCDAVASAIVQHITSSAVVQTNSGAPDGEHTGVVL